MASILPKRSSTRGDVPSTSNLASNEIAINYGDAKIYGRSGNNIVVLSEGQADSYTQNTYTSGVLTSQAKYTSNGGTLLETKTFTYSSGQLLQVVVRDASNNVTLTQNISYNPDGSVASITKDYA